MRSKQLYPVLAFSGVMLVLLISACPVTQNEPVVGHILQPALDSYSEESTLIFQAEVTLPAAVVWSSDEEGVLGDGVWFSRKLLPGTHTITLLCGSQELDRKTIVIRPVEFLRGQSRQLGLGSARNSILLAGGNYSPCLYTLDGKATTVTFPGLDASKAHAVSGKTDSLLQPRLFSLINKTLPPQNTITGGRHSTNKAQAVIGDTRSFLIADTTGMQAEGDTVQAELVFSAQRVSIWVDTNAQIPVAVLDNFLAGLTSIALPRVFAVWGEDWVDLDADNSLAVLITPLINEQGKAIGFFNPADFYPRNTDAASADYNPVSNSMDIIYVAAPVDDPAVFAYSLNSILATFCHETAHLINFSRAYYLPAVSGQTVTREELFLDEGLAHLTESLCGYGESGGNLAFFASYLNDTGRYSLCRADADGAPDSVGKRGMSAAFLAWLFWQQGGARWDAVDPGAITDLGGIAFLRRLIVTSQHGLKNISAAAGADAADLLVRWFKELDLQAHNIMERPLIVRDPLCGEALSMSPFHGELFISTSRFVLDGPVCRELNQFSVNCAFAAAWGASFTLVQKTAFNVVSSVPGNGAYLSFNMID